MQWTILQCKTCGIQYQVPEIFMTGKHESGDWWYCPNGHRWHYAETNADKERRRAECAEQELARVLEQRNKARRSLTAQKGVNTRLRKRVSAGVCPCCNRSFQNLRRHMANKHPDYQESA